jgi:ABC-type multidrug transport system fused ATPase/permease subunit
VRPFIDEIREFYELKTTITFPIVSGSAKNQLIERIQNPTVVFENVSFAYPHSKIYVLKKINLTIPCG